jgi:hypothetical protein
VGVLLVRLGGFAAGVFAGVPVVPLGTTPANSSPLNTTGYQFDFSLVEGGRGELAVIWDLAAGLAMAFKLIESAQDHWRMVNAPHLVALVRAGATFINGQLVERPGGEAQSEAA